VRVCVCLSNLVEQANSSYVQSTLDCSAPPTTYIKRYNNQSTINLDIFRVAEVSSKDYRHCLLSICLFSFVSGSVQATVVGGWNLYHSIPSTALPIHFFRHYCSKMYHSSTRPHNTQIKSKSPKFQHLELTVGSVVTWPWLFQMLKFRQSDSAHIPQPSVRRTSGLLSDRNPPRATWPICQRYLLISVSLGLSQTSTYIRDNKITDYLSIHISSDTAQNLTVEYCRIIDI